MRKRGILTSEDLAYNNAIGDVYDFILESQKTCLTESTLALGKWHRDTVASGKKRETTVNMDSGTFEPVFYEPSCRHGFSDCIHDPNYIKSTYPDWYKQLGSPTECTYECKNCGDYDDENK